MGAPEKSLPRIARFGVWYRCPADMAHIRQPRPDSGLGFQVKFLKTFQVFPLRSEAVGVWGLAIPGRERVLF